MDAPVAPARVVPREAEDYLAGLDDGGGSAGPMRVGPVIRDESSMPTHDRVGLDHEDRPAFTAEPARERGEDRAMFGLEPWMWMLAFQHGELVAQHEDLGIFGAIAPSAQYQEVEYEADKAVETGHASILPLSEPRRSCQRETAGHDGRRFFGTDRFRLPPYGLRTDTKHPAFTIAKTGDSERRMNAKGHPRWECLGWNIDIRAGHVPPGLPLHFASSDQTDTGIGSCGTSVATDTWGQDRVLKFRSTSCEYWIWVYVTLIFSGSMIGLEGVTLNFGIG